MLETRDYRFPRQRRLKRKDPRGAAPEVGAASKQTLIRGRPLAAEDDDHNTGLTE